MNNRNNIYFLSHYFMLVRKVIILDVSIFDKKRFNYFEIKDESFNLIVQYYLKKVSSKYNLFPVCESIL